MLNTQIVGTVLASKKATFKDDTGANVEYGKVQIMHRDMSGEFYAITNIKVKKESFHHIEIVAKQLNKMVSLDLTQQLYNGKASLYLIGLSANQPKA